MELVEMVKQIAESDAECRSVSPQLESAEIMARGGSPMWPQGRGLGEVKRLCSISLPLLLRNGTYLPLQSSNITQNMDKQKADIEIDQREAEEPIDGIDAPATDVAEAA